jgi:hypothetical protein
MEVAEYEKMDKFELLELLFVFADCYDEGDKKAMKKQEVKTDVKKLPNFVNSVFTSVLRIESHLITNDVNLSLGTSIVCICKKRGENEVK